MRPQPRPIHNLLCCLQCRRVLHPWQLRHQHADIERVNQLNSTQTRPNLAHCAGEAGGAGSRLPE
jgi:hypothetical protein